MCAHDPCVCVGSPPHLDAEERVETGAPEGTCSPTAPREPGPHYVDTSPALRPCDTSSEDATRPQSRGSSRFFGARARGCRQEPRRVAEPGEPGHSVHRARRGPGRRGLLPRHPRPHPEVWRRGWHAAAARAEGRDSRRVSGVLAAGRTARHTQGSRGLTGARCVRRHDNQHLRAKQSPSATAPNVWGNRKH